MAQPSDWLSEHWWNSNDPYRMIYDVIAGRGGDRKPRAFACLCCRQAWDRIGDRRSRRAVETAEGYLDGRVSPDELAAAHQPAEQARVEAKARRRENPALAAELAARPMYWAGVTSDLTTIAEWAAGRTDRPERARRLAAGPVRQPVPDNRAGPGLAHFGRHRPRPVDRRGWRRRGGVRSDSGSGRRLGGGRV